jgi:hypothetical protein
VGERSVHLWWGELGRDAHFEGRVESLEFRLDGGGDAVVRLVTCHSRIAVFGFR